MSKVWLKGLVLGGATAMASTCLHAETGAAEKGDKSHYTIFDPTPADKLREMSTDRPDATESPVTIDAGHVQIEADLFNQSRNRNKGNDTETMSLTNSVNFRIGLTNCSELDVIVEPAVSEKVKVAGKSQKESGIGDTTIRAKFNFIGNEGGPYSIGVIPFVKIPTSKKELGNDKYEGGVVIPFGLELPNEWELGMMAQVNYLKNELNDRFHTDVINSITTSHEIFKDVGGYLEFFSESSAEVDAQWIATVNVGLTWQVNPNLQMDTGVNIGATEAADDTNPFVGVSARF